MISMDLVRVGDVKVGVVNVRADLDSGQVVEQEGERIDNVGG
jgi:hypothetical protein